MLNLLINCKNTKISSHRRCFNVFFCKTITNLVLYLLNKIYNKFKYVFLTIFYGGVPAELAPNNFIGIVRKDHR